MEARDRARVRVVIRAYEQVVLGEGVGEGGVGLGLGSL